MRGSVWAIRLVVLGAFLDLFAQFPVVAPYARDLSGSTPTLVGVVVAAYSVANLVGNLGAGFVLDRWGRKPSLVVGLLGAAVALALYTIAQSTTQLMVLRVLHGLAAAVLSPGAFALLGDIAPPGQRARAMGTSGALIAVAAVVAPPTAGIMRDQFGPEAVFLTVSVVLVLIAGLVVRFVREPAVERRPAVAGERGRTLLNRPGLLVAYLAALGLTIGLGTLVTHLPLLLEALGQGARSSGMAFAAYAFVALIGMAGPAARLADRHGRQRPLAAGIGLIGVALLVLAAMPLPPGVYGAMAIFGLGFGLLFPAATALVADHSASSERGTAFGIFYAVYSLGVVIGSVMSGVLGDVLGPLTITPFLVAGAVALAAAPGILLAPVGQALGLARAEPAPSVRQQA